MVWASVCVCGKYFFVLLASIPSICNTVKIIEEFLWMGFLKESRFIDESVIELFVYSAKEKIVLIHREVKEKKKN